MSPCVLACLICIFVLICVCVHWSARLQLDPCILFSYFGNQPSDSGKTYYDVAGYHRDVGRGMIACVHRWLWFVCRLTRDHHTALDRK